MSNLYDEASYRRFAENLPHALKGKNIQHMNLKQVKKYAQKTGRQTKFGSWGWRSMISSRIGPKTVYLGSKNARLPNPTAMHKEIIAKGPDQLHKILQLLRKMPFVHLRRQMGKNNEYNPICNLYVSVADIKNYRLPYMWGNTLHEPDNKRPGPEFTMIHMPEEHQIRQMVLAMPEHHINIAMGSDYMGEDKKGFLRQAMWYADEHGMLGLHAGSKMVTVKDPKDGKLKKYGVLLFGLSATGKSTWSCHRLGLDEEHGELTEVIQDDIVFLKPDGSALGSEQNFFVKTDVDAKLQEAMYSSLTDKTSLYENVMIDANGYPDFLDESLCGNGRAVTRKDKMRIRLGRKLVSIEYPGIDLPPLSELDGLVFAFITRRNTFMPFALELNAEQAVLAYLWGESSHSMASQPAKAGESVRTVGTDPFIVGSRARKINRFRNIIMDLCDKFPGKVRFFQYNTGGIGEIIKQIKTSEGVKKEMIRKTVRVPIPLMAAIQRGDLRGVNRYEKGTLGTREIVEVPGFNLKEFDPKRCYDSEQIDAYINDIVKGRRRFTDEVAEEGLDDEILKWAETSYEISKSETGKLTPVDISNNNSILGPSKHELRVKGNDGDSLLERPPRSLAWRVK